MKKSLAAFFTSASLFATPALAGDAYILIGDAAPLHFKDVTVQQSREKCEEFAKATAGKSLTIVNVIYDPSSEERKANPDVKQTSFGCFKVDTGGIKFFDR